MHNQREYKTFMRWMSTNYEEKNPSNEKGKLKLPEIVVEKENDCDESRVSSARNKQSVNVHSKLY